MKINGRESTVNVASDVRSADCYRWSELKHELRNYYFEDDERRDVTKIIKTLNRHQSYLIMNLTITVI